MSIETNTITIWGNKTQKERLAPLPALLKDVVVRRLADRKVSQTLLFPGANGAAVRRQPSKAIARAIRDCGLNAPEMVK